MPASKALPFVAIAMFACGSAPSPPPASGASPTEAKTEDATKGDAAAARAGWDRLVNEERVWRRPDLDVSCDSTRSGHYMASAPVPFEEGVVLASQVGCKPISFVLPTTAGDSSSAPKFPGGAYCCPRDLSPAAPPHTGGGKSCEQAVDEYRAEGVHDGERTSADTYGAILNRGSYFKHCGVSDTTTIEICAAILDGRTAGVTVRTNPVDPGPAECIAKAVVGLSFPKSTRMDVTRTSF